MDDDKTERPILRSNDFIAADDFVKDAHQKHVVEFGYHSSDQASQFEIEFHTKEQPAFNRQFDMLINDLKQWEKKGFEL